MSSLFTKLSSGKIESLKSLFMIVKILLIKIKYKKIIPRTDISHYLVEQSLIFLLK